MTTELAPYLAQKDIDTISRNKDRIAKINQACAQLRSFESNLDDWEIDLQFGAYLKVVRDSITPDQLEIMSNYQNTRIGFLTDRTSGYDTNVLKNIFIEALTLGLRLRGNEFNILGGNLYVTKYGLARLLDELIEKNGYVVTGRDNPKINLTPQGNYNLVYDITVKDVQRNIILSVQKKEIPIKAKYTKGEKSYELGIDAVQGKAQRKIDNFIYSKLSKRKNLLPEGSVEDVDLPSITQPKATGKVSVSQIMNKEPEEKEDIIEGETE